MYKNLFDTFRDLGFFSFLGYVSWAGYVYITEEFIITETDHHIEVVSSENQCVCYKHFKDLHFRLPLI